MMMTSATIRMSGLCGEDWRLDQSSKTRESRPDAEHKRVERLDVDAERTDHFTVGRAGADEHADACVHRHEIEKQPPQ
jgi:hypothetical protein